MPALTMFGRRWLSGSDDFLITGFFFCMWNVICTCLIFIPYFHGNCPQESALPLGIITVIGAVIFFFLTIFTMKGRILEPSSRNKPVIVLLYLATAQNLALIIAGIVSCVQFFKDEFPAMCTHREGVALKVASIKTLMLPVLFFAISLIIRWDPHGAVSDSQLRQDPQLYHDTWVTRVKKLFCCQNSEDNSEYFDHIASVMSFLFQGHDLVATDILAGLTLLSSHQRRVMKKRSQELVKYDMSNIDLEHGQVQGHNGDIKVSHQAIPLHALTEDDKKIVDDVAYFSKYFMAAYGWALYVFRDLKCGFCKLCTNDCTSCCRTRPYPSIGDNCCGYNSVALQATTGLKDEDIIMASFENEMMLPTFYVALDRSTSTVVIAIRGTMSIEDTMVDLVATPTRMVVSDLANNNNNSTSATASSSSFSDSCMVHGGILRAATNVFDRLTKNGIFKALVEEGGSHRDKKVVIIGHSLGAGVATLLALIVRERFPTQLREPRLTTFAVSPPGGLLSRDLAEYTRGFIVSPFVGMDVIPRLSMQNMINMRDATFECLSAAEHNKNIVFLHSACPCSCCQGTLLPPPDAVGELPPEIAKRVSNLLSRNQHHSGENVAKVRDERIKARATTSTTSTATNSASSSPSTMTTTGGGGGGGIDSLSQNLTTSPSFTVKIDHGLETLDSLKSFDIKLYPPGRLLMYANVASIDAHCECSYCCGKSGTDALCNKKIHLPTWVTQDDLDEIVVCSAMGLDHLPDRCQNIFENAQEFIRDTKKNRIEGFFSKELTAESAEKERRRWEPTWFHSPALRTNDHANHNNINNNKGDRNVSQSGESDKMNTRSRSYGSTENDPMNGDPHEK